MAAAAPARYCTDCKTTAVTKRIQTSVHNTKPVDLSLCECDHPRCRACNQPIRDGHASKCGTCNTPC